MIKSDSVQTFKKQLKESGVYVTQAKGRSMLPFLKERSDVLVIESVDDKTVLDKGDVLLYPGHNGEFILHRLHGFDGELLKINGDNCDFWESIHRSDIVGRLSFYYKQGEEKALSGFIYRTYLYLWIYPWPVRFFVKKVYRRLKKYLKLIWRRP